MGPSTLSSWVLLIARTLQARGSDPAALFRQARMDPEQLHDAHARYPLAAVQRLWVLAAQASADPCFGLDVGRAWHPTSFHALGYAALAAATLREALAYVARYSRVVSTGARFELAERGSEVAFILRGELAGALAPDSLPVALQAGLAAVAVLCRELRGAPIGLSRVSFSHDAAQACRARLESFFECAVVLGAGEDALVFRAEAIDAPIATANPLLARINEQALAQYHAQVESAQLADRVRAELVRLLPAGDVDQTAMARSLHLSLRSLQRRLRDEGTSFRELLDETRRRLAEQYSRDSTLSVSEIAYLLGFEEPSSFSRAMRRWRSPAPRRPSQRP